MPIFLDGLHQHFVFPRRVRVLSERLAKLLPPHASVLDVGCGDGEISQSIHDQRPDLRIEGLEVLLRGAPRIRVSQFDGRNIPFPDKSFHVVMFVDVLHHADDPAQLLREAARVASESVVLKDHAAEGVLAFSTLRFLDWVGNARHGVALPYDYWKPSQWREELQKAGLSASQWETSLHLYPWPASMLFDRSLHFIAKMNLTGG